MGNDGGSIPTRRELVRTAARLPTVSELKETTLEHVAHSWSFDPLTSQPLRAQSIPVVSDVLGRLFRKDGVIEFLLPAADEDVEARKRKEEWGSVMRGAVKSLKDVVEVKFELDSEESTTKWICPVTRKVLDEHAKAVYLVPCGHAFEEVAVMETMLETEGNEGGVEKPRCLQCNEPYATNDVIPILPTSDLDIARLTLRTSVLKERGLSHSLKKSSGANKKRKTHAAIETQVAATAAPMFSDIEAKDEKVPRASIISKGSSGIKDASTASLTAKVLEEQETRNKKRKLEQNEGLDSLFSKKEDGSHVSTKGKNRDFMTRGYALT